MPSGLARASGQARAVGSAARRRVAASDDARGGVSSRRERHEARRRRFGVHQRRFRNFWGSREGERGPPSGRDDEARRDVAVRLRAESHDDDDDDDGPRAASAALFWCVRCFGYFRSHIIDAPGNGRRSRRVRRRARVK